MKVALTIKNTGKVIKPVANDVIIYDGHEWYITTKEKLFKEWTSLLNECNKTLEDTKKENKAFKSEVGEQLKEMTDLIHKLLNLKGDNL